MQTALLDYLNNLNFNEEPLVGMMQKPAHLLTDSELREFVQKQRLLRESRQSFKAAVAYKGTTEKAPAKNIFNMNDDES